MNRINNNIKSFTLNEKVFDEDEILDIEEAQVKNVFEDI